VLLLLLVAIIPAAEAAAITGRAPAVSPLSCMFLFSLDKILLEE
jgi:hypothetical protein